MTDADNCSQAKEVHTEACSLDGISKAAGVLLPLMALIHKSTFLNDGVDSLISVTNNN